MVARFPDSESVMRRALELARLGAGRVEPNPMVGAVVVDSQFNLLGEGWHESFGGPHAEVHALRAAGERARGATLFVTLEPCSHHGKTPPCVDAVIAAGIARVIIGRQDPAQHVNGRGIAALRAAGIAVEVGLLGAEAMQLTAPFAKLIATGRPYVHAKWAMTVDGKIATETGESKWISNEASRATTHRLRGCMDAIIVGSGTALADDPMLTARPPGARTAARIVVDSRALVSSDSNLVRTAKEVPVIVAASAAASAADVLRLSQAGVEVLRCEADATEAGRVDLPKLFQELGRRQMTNVLVEGGSKILGSLFDARLVDEVHVFIAPKIFGGKNAVPAVAGAGWPNGAAIPRIVRTQIEVFGEDVYIHGPVNVAGE